MEPVVFDPPTSDEAQTAADHLAPPRAARRAVTAVFFLNGLILSNWVPRIPTVQRELELSNAALGLALLGVAAGALIAMPAAGWAVTRFGSRPVTRLALLALAAVLPTVALAPSWLALTGNLALLGAANGAVDVAMNAQGVVVERRYRRPILSSFHAAFSFGGLGGAITGGLAASLAIDPLPHFLAVAIAGGSVGVVVSRGLLPASADIVARKPRSAPSARPRRLSIPRRLIALGLIGFCCLLGEGSMADWSAVYLKSELGTSDGLAAAGFAAFSLTMAVGRLFGDQLAIRWGPVALVRWGGALVAIVLGLALLADHPVAAIIGCGAVGAGLAGIVPVVFSAAGHTPGLASGPAIATVSTMGYTGFLVGPPAIGLTAELTGLPVALGIVVGMGVLIVALAGSAGPMVGDG